MGRYFHLRFLRALPLALAAIAARAAEPPPLPWTSYPLPASFEHISTAQGLSHGTVYCVLQDAQGFLWFGTEIGLNRYDGFGYKIYHPVKNDSESLGSDWVNDLLEDRQGSIWIAMNGGGLTRLDRERRKFRRYYPKSKSGEIPENSVVRLAQDGEGNLWLGTGKGVFMLPEKEMDAAQPAFRSFPFFTESPQGQPDGAIISLFPDKQGALWIGTEAHGLWRVKTGTDSDYRFERIYGLADAGDSLSPDLSPPDAFAVAEDLHGILWIGSTQGLYSYTRSTGSFRRYVHDDADPKSLSFNLVRKIYRDRGGGIWLGTDGGGLEKMLPRGRPEDAPRFGHLQHDNKNPSSLSSNAIESIFEDRSGVLWIGTYFMGLNKLILNGGPGGERDKSPLLQYRTIPGDSTSLSGNMVNAIAEDGFGNLWIGTDGYGLNRVVRPAHAGEAFRFEHFRAGPKRGSLPDDVVTGLFLDSKKRFWMTTYTAGLVRIDAASPAAKPVFTAYRHDPKNPKSLNDDFTWAVLEDRSHRLWIGTDGGSLELFDPETGAFRHFRHDGINPGEMSEAGIYSILEDSYGTLWIGSYFGVSRFNPETGEFKSYYQNGKPGGLSDSYAGTLYLDRAGILWIGTNSGGLNRVSIPPWDGPAPQFIHYGSADGLPNNTVMSILEDGRGQLWISTSQALCRFDPQTGQAHHFVWNEEMKRTSFIRNATYRGPNGELFFGGSNGLSLFRPEEIVYNSYAPPVVVTDFKILNRSVGLRERAGRGAASFPGGLFRNGAPSPDIILSAEDYAFSFEFAAMHFVAPGENQYAFKMEGLDRDWNYSGNKHFIAYTTLPPGNYTFRAKGSNCDGIWGDEALAVSIRVLPPWWKTWWFRILVSCVVTAAVLAGIRLRLRALRDQNKILGEMVEEKTREMKEILDNIEQGLFTIGLDGKVNKDHALITNNILQVENVAGHSVKELFRMDEGQFQEWEKWLRTIKAEHANMKWSQLVALSPVKLLTVWTDNGPRFVQIAFQKMFDKKKKFNKLMILAQDTTEVRRKEERIEEERVRHERSVKAILGIAQNAATMPVLVEDVASRLDDMRDLLGEKSGETRDLPPQDVEALFREARNLKGTALSFGFESLSSACQEFENLLVEVRGRGGRVDARSGARLADCLNRIQSALDEIRGLADRLTGGGAASTAVPLDRVERIRGLCRALRARLGKDREGFFDELERECEAIDHKRLGLLTENYRLMLERLADHSGKKAEFRVEPENLEISPRTLMELNEPLIHLLRNAVEHGIETEEERKRLGKPACGRVTLGIETGAESWSVSVSDDGGGIDLDRLIQKAVETGSATWEKLDKMDEAEKVKLMFFSGLTTRAQGGPSPHGAAARGAAARGAGMGAVFAWARAAGGRADIEFHRGQGTKVTLILPVKNSLETDWIPKTRKSVLP